MCVASMSTRLLFVCIGNTCRSPMAAALAEAHGALAESAGVSAQVSDRAAPNAIRALKDARGLSLRDHEPRDVSDVRLADFDQIVAMDPTVAHRLHVEHGVDTDTLVTWAVSDPYGGMLIDYRRCLEKIATALEDFLASSGE